MQAIILAGGFGTRLRSLLGDIPKPMAPIHGRPFLAYVLDHLHAQGITQVTLSVHYLREQIQNYFHDTYHGVAINYVVEEKPLGTGGAIKFSLLQTASSSAEPMFVLNGDTFLRLDYRAMYKQHKASKALLTMALHEEKNCSRYGAVVTKGKQVIAFQEKGQEGAGYINAGVYLVQPDLFSAYPMPEQFSFETDFLFPKIQSLKPQAFVVNDYFIDIGIPEDYARAVMQFRDEMAPVTA